MIFMRMEERKFRAKRKECRKVLTTSGGLLLAFALLLSACPKEREKEDGKEDTGMVDSGADSEDTACWTPPGYTSLCYADTTYYGEPKGAYLWLALSGVGDVNGDGFDDLVGGGQAVAIYGPPEPGLVALEFDTGLDTPYCWSLDGLDANGDGFADALCGTNEYSAYLFLGAPEGLNIDTSAPSERSRVHEFISKDRGYGEVISSAGDVDGDATDELLIAGGAHLWNAELFDGPFDGGVTNDYEAISTFEVASDFTGLGDVDGDGLDDIGVTGGPSVYIVFAPSASSYSASDSDVAIPVEERFRQAISAIGDIDGDGLDDLATASALSTGGYGAHVQAVFVYYASSLLGGGDPGAADGIVRPESDDPSVGWALESAGDIDLDGRADLMVGSMNGVYLFPGPIHGTHDVEEAPLKYFYSDYRSRYSSGVGGGVDHAGDMNGDGSGDLAILDGTYCLDGYCHEKAYNSAIFVLLGSSLDF